MRVRVKYSKQGLMRFIGHLDMMRYFQKACRRAGIDVVYTEGLSPHMSMSFALPLGVGMTSDSEYVDVDLVDPMSGEEIVERLNRSVPEGIHFIEARQIPVGKAHKGMTLAARADYTLQLKDDSGIVPKESHNDTEDIKEEISSIGADETIKEEIPCEHWSATWRDAFLAWLDQPEIMVLKKGKKTEKEINIRPLIYQAGFNGPDLILGLSAGLDRNIRPELVMQAFAQQTGRPYRSTMFSINRDEVFADRGKDGMHVFVSLIDLGEVIKNDPV